MHKHRKVLEDGFTMIELVIVVVILGILTAVAIPTYDGLRKNATVNTLNQANAHAYTAAVATFENEGYDRELHVTGDADKGEIFTGTMWFNPADAEINSDVELPDYVRKNGAVCTYSFIHVEGEGPEGVNGVQRVGGDPFCGHLWKGGDWVFGYGA